MTDILERAEALIPLLWGPNGTRDTLNELVAELKAERVMREETQRQLSQFIADFCALRDALPREQVEQILAKETAK